MVKDLFNKSRFNKTQFNKVHLSVSLINASGSIIATTNFSGDIFNTKSMCSSLDIQSNIDPILFTKLSNLSGIVRENANIELTIQKLSGLIGNITGIK